VNCLVVGRTWEDQNECIDYGLNSHPPAPSTLEIDYKTFPGDIISCHTVKPWSSFACSVECSQRVIDSALANPTKVIIGQSELHKLDDDSPLWESAIVFDHAKGHRHPDGNSGQFALWWALESGYENIYTCGLDFVNDKERIYSINGMIKRYSANVYKVSNTSWLPVPIKHWL